ncbi:hypothetical protein Efla_001788 [Eimeria flavescens]
MPPPLRCLLGLILILSLVLNVHPNPFDSGGSQGAPYALHATEDSESLSLERRVPAADKRQYRYVLLSNQLRALLIHEPDGDEAAAALRVGVGSAGDPRSLQGLAHFTEHMLFQGSRHFPGGHSFLDFIHLNGGRANAFTSKYGTTFSFSLSPRCLREALVRLTDIFSFPEFREENIEKEIHAVHSEYILKATDDSIRFAHFVRQSRLQTPFSNFSVGSLNSLLNEPKAQGIDVALEMRKFHQRWYSSNLMTLSVVGRESLDELQSLVVPLLGQIPNRNAPKPQFTECSIDYQPFAQDELRTFTVAAPQADLRQLRFLFALPPQEYAWDMKPLSYIRHFIDLQGPESLSSKLKKAGLATAVSSGEMGPEYCSLLEVRFTLTEEGLREESVAIIGDLFFAYLRTIRESGLEAWRYEELAEIKSQQFDFAEMPSAYELSQRAAEGLRYFPVREVLAGDIQLYRFDKELLLSLIVHYLNPDNMRVLLLDKALGNNGDRLEPRYKVKHSTRPIDSWLLNRWRDSFAGSARSPAPLLLQHEFALPEPNPFIARSLKLQQTPLLQLSAHPKRLTYGPGHPCYPKETFSGVSAAAATCNVFHKKDDTFRVPKTAVTLDFYFKPKRGDSIRHHVLTALYVRLASFSITEAFNSASVAGVSSFLTHGVHAASAQRPNALALHAAGFSAHLPSLLRTVAACLGQGHSPAVSGGEAGGGRHSALGSTSPACPTARPFLAREFIAASWEWLEVAAKVAATNRSPSLQAADAFGLLVVSPYIDPKQVLAEVAKLKADYLQETPAVEGDTRQWLQRLYEDVVLWGYGLWEEVYVEGLIHGSIEEAEAGELLTSLLSALPVRRLVGEEEAEAFVSVSPLETLGPDARQLQQQPTQVFVRTSSAPLRRLRGAADGQPAAEVTAAEAETETDTEGEMEEETAAAAAAAAQRQRSAALHVSTLNSNPFDEKNHTLLVVQVRRLLAVKALKEKGRHMTLGLDPQLGSIPNATTAAETAMKQQQQQQQQQRILSVCLQAGRAVTVREKAKAFLLHQLMSQRFFNVLRTDEQLGYLTSMGTMRLEASFYFSFMITSLYDPSFVASRIQHFLTMQRRQRVERKQLQELKDGAVSFWSQKPKSLFEEFQRHLNQIKRREYIFDFHQRMVARIQEVEDGELEAYREEKLFQSPSVVVEVYSQLQVPEPGPES